VLDDATSAVVPRVEQEILAGVARGGDDRPTVVMVAYRMSSVALADVVVHVESGRVVDVGTHDELLARDPGYRELATAYAREAERRENERADATDDSVREAGEDEQVRDGHRDDDLARQEETEEDDVVRHVETGALEE
ncbi:MAG: hypothetical protein ACTMHR_13145, partial [Cellulosimicrobium funkei]